MNNMTSTYQPLEKRLFGQVLKQTKSLRQTTADIINTGTRTLYGMAMLPLRIPTFSRKFLNEQTMAQISTNDLGQNEKYRDGVTAGALLGFASGCAVWYNGLNYLIDQASQGNYTPLIAVGITNLISLAFELGRLPISRQEFQEAEKIREARADEIEKSSIRQAA